MKAIVCAEYGTLDIPVLKDVANPVPGDSEVLIKVHASSVNYANVALVVGKPFLVRFSGGFSRPKNIIPGGDVAGRVEAVGKKVTQFKPGDEVFGDLTNRGFGAFAEYVCVPEEAVVQKPVTISFEQAAAAAQAAVVALQGLRDTGQIKVGQRAMIVGASGGIGSFAVQIAKSYGAEVTAVCSTRSFDLVRSLGADYVIDYTRDDFTKMEQRYDLILATAGYRPITDYKKILGPAGIYAVTGGALKQIFQALLLGPLMSKAGGRKLCSVSHKVNQKDLFTIKELFEAGKLKSVIDKTYTLSQAAEALMYYAKGHSQGKVVITMGNA